MDKNINTVDLIKSIATMCSSTLAIVAFLIAVIKPLRNNVVRIFKNMRYKRNKEIYDQISTITSSIEVLANGLKENNSLMQEHIEQDKKKEEILYSLQKDSLCNLRTGIKDTYYRYRIEKKIPEHEMECIIKHYDQYHEDGGNTFIDKIYKEMIEWEVIE